MRRLLLRLAPVLHLTRVTSAFAAVANVWLVILWTRVHDAEHGPAEVEEGRLWLLLAGGTVAALGLFAFGASLNDVLDQRRDRALHPHRPLASGQVTQDTALFLVAGSLVAAILGATVFGTGGVLLSLLIATAIMGFNAAGKFIPAIGFLLLGLINSGHMVIPNVRLVFVWPVVLVLTHSLVLAYGVFVWRKLAQYGRGARAAEKIGRYGSLWLALYAGGWFVGQGEVGPTLIIGLLSLAGLLGMTAMREAYGLVEQPLRYRR